MPSIDTSLPYPKVGVTAAVHEYEQPKKWELYEDPEQSASVNSANIRQALYEIWEYICKARTEGMKIENLWMIHPHLYEYGVYKWNNECKDINRIRTMLNIYYASNLLYEMERWYIPPIYGEEILDLYALQFPFTTEQLEAAMNRPKDMRSPSACRANGYVRNYWDNTPFLSCDPTNTDLASVAKEMYAKNFPKEYMKEGMIRSLILHGIMKPINIPATSFKADPFMEKRLNQYLTALIGVMAINTNGHVDNMCAIELWGAGINFVFDGYPAEMIVELQNEIRDFKGGVDA